MMFMLCQEIVNKIYNNQQDTTTWTKSQYLWCKALVQCLETFFLVHSLNTWNDPIVLAIHCILVLILNTSLDNIKWSVEHSTKSTRAQASNKVVSKFFTLACWSWQVATNTKNKTKVTCIPNTISPKSWLKTIVESKWTFCL